MENGFQLVMPLNCGESIPEDDPVRLLNAVMERMDYRRVWAAYSREGRIEYSPKILAKILVYGYMRRIISSRGIEDACRDNIRFMYLLEGQRAPDHNTIARFRSKILVREAGQDLLRQLVVMLKESGLLSMDAVFIDGTKIQANANKYSFVWRKATEKKVGKVLAKIHEAFPEILKNLGIHFHVSEEMEIRHLKKLRKKLYAKIKEADIQFVHGKGQRKTPLQRALEQVEEWVSQAQAIHQRSEHLWGQKQLQQNGSRRHMHAHERRSHAEWTAETGLQCKHSYLQ